jgi:hypothetical protein
MNLNKVDFTPNRSINLTTLTHPRLKETILAATADCYLSHCSREQPVDLDACAAQLGRFYTILRDLNDIEFALALNNTQRRTGILNLQMS